MTPSGPTPADGRGGPLDGVPEEDRGLDLRPRDVDVAEQVRRERRRGARRWWWAVAAVVVVAAGFVLAQGVGTATLYFRNADEAVAERDELGERRFRLQGTVVGETIADAAGGVSFDVEYDDVRVPVRHVGDPPDLFQAGIPVVLEGRWADGGDHFDSSVMIVRHTNEYEADYGDRLDRADVGGETASGAGDVIGATRAPDGAGRP